MDGSILHRKCKTRDKHKYLSLALWLFGYCVKAYSYLIYIHSFLLQTEFCFCLAWQWAQIRAYCSAFSSVRSMALAARVSRKAFWSRQWLSWHVSFAFCSSSCLEWACEIGVMAAILRHEATVRITTMQRTESRKLEGAYVPDGDIEPGMAVYFWTSTYLRKKWKLDCFNYPFFLLFF